MGARQRDWARRTRDALLEKMGAFCCRCGAKEGDQDKYGRAVKLTFDCIVATRDGNRGHHKRYDWSWRMSFYRRQFQEDNLQVLCDSCNSIKGETTMDWRREPELNWEHLGPFAFGKP